MKPIAAFCNFSNIVLALFLLTACKPQPPNTADSEVVADNHEINTFSYRCDDLVQARQFNEAFSVCLAQAQAGNINAQARLGFLYTSEEIGKTDWEQGIYWLAQAAEQGHAQAQFMVGKSYYFGQGVKQDDALAVAWLQKAAKANVVPAQVLLGECYLNGRGTEQDISHGVQWITLGAQQGDPLALYHLGMLYLEGKGVNRNVYIGERYLKQAAEQNIARAQLEVAKLYHEGRYFTQDEKMAYKWYQAAAAQDEPQSLYVVGLSLIQGTHQQTQDIDKGAAYLNRAANKGYYPAQYALATLFLEGYPVLKDKFVAIEYLRQAAIAGSHDAQVKLAKVLIDFSIPQYDQVAFYWLLQAVKGQRQDAIYLLGQCYMDGIGTEVDYPSAFEIFNRLSLQNHPLAQLKLGQLYYYGQGVEPNLSLAKKWFLKSATQGISEAKNWIATLYREGFNNVDETENQEELNQWLQYAQNNDEPEVVYLKGICYFYGKSNFQQDVDYGLQLIETAALKEFVLAQRELGMIYEQGLFNLSNLNKAYEWYLKASQNGDAQAQLALANMYYSGNGIPQNYVQSYAWANLASLNGQEQATRLKNEITNLLESADIAKAREMADNYFLAYKDKNKVALPFHSQNEH
ncbi:MAG: sel1 repeat family protein [Proteobacteria bacterium]|nr:sel1 repeat family protein [Pseudomonadota bacterium]